MSFLSGTAWWSYTGIHTPYIEEVVELVWAITHTYGKLASVNYYRIPVVTNLM